MQRDVEISIVIPVFNGGSTIRPLIEEVQSVFVRVKFEIVLINDGSLDDSETICHAIAGQYPDTVTFIQLSRNFGEHNAVLAGLSRAQGTYVGVLDDDGQNPPAELLRLWGQIQATGADVVYGRFIKKQHGWLRNVGSWFNGLVATVLLGKSRALYLSSFKVMSRELVQDVLKYQGPFPHLDGLIFRFTNRIGQMDVVHRRRDRGRSGYTLRKLVALWLNLCLGFSILPLRFVMICGTLTWLLVVVLAACNLVVPSLAAAVLAGLMLLAGIQLLALGVTGEYLGRVHLHQNGMPPYVIRYVEGDHATPL
jgi:glycosyltransferase involved in cell wall biosynthesis